MFEQVLGQVAPLATTNTDLYTVGAAKRARSELLVICNRGVTDMTYRVALRKGGAALANQHYLEYDVTLRANRSVFLPVAISMSVGDIITVYASTANASFTLTGGES